uniref:ubiquitin carboxyl-terminal hydrolase 2-like n=1 Tax=Myxine glutinosa TaxID=7769 RepID=UPI00358F4089
MAFSINPSSLFNAVIEKAPYYNDEEQQQDAPEFMMFILDQLHEEMKHIPPRSFNTDFNHLSDNASAAESWAMNNLNFNNSIIYETFYGQQQFKIVCSSCDNASITFEPFLFLSLPWPQNRRTQDSHKKNKHIQLTDCLSSFFQNEEEWFCSHCRAVTKSTIRRWLSKPPEVLSLQLIRSNNVGKKINALVEFPLSGLEMAPYCSDAVLKSSITTYDLYAVINHKKLSFDLAHFTAITRRPCISDTKNSVVNWRLFDDEEVFNVKEDQVCRKKAYLLMYHRRRTPAGHTLS